MTWSELQSILDHQLGRQLEISPKLQSACIARHLVGQKLSLVFEFGQDGIGDNNEYRNKKDGSQKTMCATVVQTVCIRASWLNEDGRWEVENLWVNDMVNSWWSVIPKKYIFQEESIGKTSKF